MFAAMTAHEKVGFFRPVHHGFVDRKLALFREVFDLDDVPVEAMCAAASLTRRLHAVDATPARWRGGAALSLLDLTGSLVNLHAGTASRRPRRINYSPPMMKKHLLRRF